MTAWTLLARLATRNARQQEHVVLPEPGRSLWTKTYEVVRDELKRIGTPRLGGGTVLAGRWKHRTSVDIDLSIEPSPRRRPYSVTGCGTDFLQWKWAEMDRAVGEVAA